MADPKDLRKKTARILAKAWLDPSYKARLKSDPGSVLKDEGIDVPAGTKFQVHENAPGTMHLVIPRKPDHIKAEHLQDPDKMLPEFCVVTVSI